MDRALVEERLSHQSRVSVRPVPRERARGAGRSPVDRGAASGSRAARWTRRGDTAGISWAERAEADHRRPDRVGMPRLSGKPGQLVFCIRQLLGGECRGRLYPLIDRLFQPVIAGGGRRLVEAEMASPLHHCKRRFIWRE